jgi:ABC-type transporter Mla subunit MlaD
MRLRHADEWVGVLVLLGVAAFVAAVLHAGVLSNWFQPVSRLRILLPEAGVAGLSAGAEVEVLGIRAGTVRRIVIDPQQRMHADVDIDDQARAFIRRDSLAVVRRRFSVAGAAFIDISRGHGAAARLDLRRHRGDHRTGADRRRRRHHRRGAGQDLSHPGRRRPGHARGCGDGGADRKRRGQCRPPAGR